MSESSRSLARLLVESAFNRGELETVDEVISRDHVMHDPATPVASGPDGVKRMVTLYRDAFPDLHLSIEDLIDDNDRVVVRWTGHGRHQGALMGIEATGRLSTMSGIAIHRVAGGRIVETWSVWDTLGMLAQLGVVGTWPQASL